MSPSIAFRISVYPHTTYIFAAVSSFSIFPALEEPPAMYLSSTERIFCSAIRIMVPMPARWISVVETAKRNKQDVFGYLRYLLTTLPQWDNELPMAVQFRNALELFTAGLLQTDIQPDKVTSNFKK